MIVIYLLFASIDTRFYKTIIFIINNISLKLTPDYSVWVGAVVHGMPEYLFLLSALRFTSFIFSFMLNVDATIEQNGSGTFEY